MRPAPHPETHSFSPINAGQRTGARLKTFALVLGVALVHGLLLAWMVLGWPSTTVVADAPALFVQMVATPEAPSIEKPAPPAKPINKPVTAKPPAPAAASPTQTIPAPSPPLAAPPAPTPAKGAAQGPSTEPAVLAQAQSSAVPTPAGGAIAPPSGLGQPPVAEAPTSASPRPISTPARSATPPRFDAAYLRNPKPRYPMQSRKLGESGTVWVRAFVEPSGSPSQVTVDRSSGFERLDAAALEAVKAWRFEPARLGDQTVGGWVLVPIPFVLSD